LVQATGSATKLLVTDRAVLRKMRHADEEVTLVSRRGSQVRARKDDDGHAK
jgi:hypothetical protein